MSPTELTFVTRSGATLGVPMIYIVFSVFLLFQAWVTWRLWRNDIFLRSEKLAQTKLVWLVPLLGAVMVYSMLIDEAKHEVRGRRQRQ